MKCCFRRLCQIEECNVRISTLRIFVRSRLKGKTNQLNHLCWLIVTVRQFSELNSTHSIYYYFPFISTKVYYLLLNFTISKDGRTVQLILICNSSKKTSFIFSPARTHARTLSIFMFIHLYSHKII